jgi:hypothetical protein
MTLLVLEPTTIRELLGRAIKDERSLSLASADAHIIRRESTDRVQFSIVLGTALTRRGLMDLLYTLAPYKAHGPDRFARVLDNWGLHDRAKSSSASESLLLEHAKSLKFAWHEFARHRQVFIDVLQDQAENRCVAPLLTWSKRRDGKRTWDFDLGDGPLLNAIEEMLPVLFGDRKREQTILDSLVGLVTIPYFLPELRRKWRAWQPLVKGGKSNYIGPASVPVVALMHQRAILNSALISCAEEYAQSLSRP